MNQATIQSRCECQARLWASLNQQRLVTTGWATELRRNRQEPCTAHSINADQEQFQVAWLCPFCGRNTLRSFYAGALSWRQARLSERPPARPPATVR
jgi:predicted RNA-binding Zn-ribbon protein involved in translation (DUF1610 family)